MRKSKIEIINETAEYYSADVSRRAYNDEVHVCQYKTPDGKMCAVGRCLENPEEIINQNGGVVDIFSSGFELKAEYRGHDYIFWRDVQMLHDRPFNWDKKGLSESGKYHLNELLEKYS